MARLWLPFGSLPYPHPKDERERLLNRLWELRVLVPGAREMELSQLRDYVQWQEYKAAERARKQAQEIAYVRRYSEEQIAGALKELAEWRRARQEGRAKLMVVRP